MSSPSWAKLQTLQGNAIDQWRPNDQAQVLQAKGVPVDLRALAAQQTRQLSLDDLRPPAEPARDACRLRRRVVSEIGQMLLTPSGLDWPDFV
jgi:hypothetical protein